MADNQLGIRFGTSVDFTNANSEIKAFIKNIKNISDIKLNVSVNKSVLNETKAQITEVNNLVAQGSKATKQSNAEAYYKNLLNYVVQYKMGLMDLNSYITKLQQLMYNKNGDVTGNFKNMDLSRQLQVAEELNSALRTQEAQLREIQNTTQAINNSNNTGSSSASKQAELYNMLNSLAKEEYRLQEQINQARTSGNAELEQEYQKQLAINRAKQQNINNNIANNNLVNYEREAQLLNNINNLETQARTNALQRTQTEQNLESILKNQLKLLQLQAQSVEKRYGNIGNTQSNLEQWNAQLNSLIDSNGNFTTSLGNVRVALQNARSGLSQIRTEARNSYSVFNRLADNFRTFASFLIGGNMFMGLFRGFKSAISYINEMDTYLTNVRIITGQTAEEVAGLTNEYQKLGQELGMVSTDIAKIAEDFYRQGKSMAETQELIKSTSMMATLSGMEMGQSTEYMTSILNGFKLEAKDAQDIVSKLVAVDNSAATSVAELGEALSKTSAVAQSVGVDFDTLIGYIGTISSVTRQDASSIGQSVKTILTRMADIKIGDYLDDGVGVADVEKVLGSVGIALKENETTFRNFGDILSDLAKKWNTLSDVEQSALAKTIAGYFGSLNIWKHI